MVAVAEELKGRHFTRVADWSREELGRALDLADELKRLQHAREPHELLPGRTLGMIFQKPSTRTRVSFEVGIYQLGGTAIVRENVPKRRSNRYIESCLISCSRSRSPETVRELSSSSIEILSCGMPGRSNA